MYGGSDVSDPTLASELEALAERIGRIRGIGKNGDMDPFLVDRSQAKADARSLMTWARTGHPPAGYVRAEQRTRDDEGRTRYSQR